MGSARCTTMRHASCFWEPWPVRRRAARVSSICIRATGSGRSWKRCSPTRTTPLTAWAPRCNRGVRSRCDTTSRYGMRSNPVTFATPATRASAMWCRAIWLPSSPVRASTTSIRAGRSWPRTRPSSPAANHIYTCGAKATALYHRYCEPDLAAQGITLPATALPSTSPAYAAAILDDLIATYRARIDWNAYRTPVVDGAGRRPTHRI